jgi:crotonobetainyl-CoA:carnitine CoA-transferase CaiB-like acyl-CoA transferase
MKAAGAPEIVRRLVRSSDVVLHNFRPGKAEQIGLGYEQLSSVKADLIYGHLPGYGTAGPRAMMKSFAPLLSGFVGLNYQGAGQGNRPVRRVLGNEDFYNGFMGAAATLMALEHRAKTGRGQQFSVSQLNATLFTATGCMLDENERPVQWPVLDSGQTGWSPLFRLYQASDGWIALGCVGAACFQRLRNALALPDVAADDPRLASLIAQQIAARRTEKVMSLLDSHDVPAEIARTDVYMDELLWDEWAEQSGRVFEQYHPTIGLIREIGLGVHLSDTPGANRGPAALLGQHSRELLLELGYDQAAVEHLLSGACKGFDT